jgi:hypothetical protein
MTSQSAWPVNYAERYCAGLRVGTSIMEGTANFLVNRRMNKSQQMRWSLRGADLLLQVRCAIVNGKFGSSFGQLFQAVDPDFGAEIRVRADFTLSRGSQAIRWETGMPRPVMMLMALQATLASVFCVGKVRA